uniref:hydroxymethylglutaryl-CoA lyase n=1 Tax=Steinernema glaseri TaxID=37863 RepID=A0A1I7Y3E2_9BILA
MWSSLQVAPRRDIRPFQAQEAPVLPGRKSVYPVLFSLSQAASPHESSLIVSTPKRSFDRAIATARAFSITPSVFQETCYFELSGPSSLESLSCALCFVPTEQKIELINRLGRSGLKVVECASYVSPKWVPQMKDNDAVVNGIDHLPGVSYPVLVPNMAGMKNVLKNKNVKEIAVFAAASEGFSKKNTNCSIEESLKRLGEVAEEAIKNGIKVRGYTSVVIGCPYDGKTNPAKVAALSEALLSMGCYEGS